MTIDIDELPAELRDRLLDAVLRLAEDPEPSVQEAVMTGLAGVRQALRDHALDAVPSTPKLRGEVRRRVEGLEALAEGSAELSPQDPLQDAPPGF